MFLPRQFANIRYIYNISSMTVYNYLLAGIDVIIIIHNYNIIQVHQLPYIYIYIILYIQNFNGVSILGCCTLV